MASGVARLGNRWSNGRGGVRHVFVADGLYRASNLAGFRELFPLALCVVPTFFRRVISLTYCAVLRVVLLNGVWFAFFASFSFLAIAFLLSIAFLSLAVLFSFSFALAHTLQLGSKPFLLVGS